MGRIKGPCFVEDVNFPLSRTSPRSMSVRQSEMLLCLALSHSLHEIFQFRKQRDSRRTQLSQSRYADASWQLMREMHSWLRLWAKRIAAFCPSSASFGTRKSVGGRTKVLLRHMAPRIVHTMVQPRSMTVLCRHFSPLSPLRRFTNCHRRVRRFFQESSSSLPVTSRLTQFLSTVTLSLYRGLGFSKTYIFSALVVS